MSTNETAREKSPRIAVALRYELGVGLPHVVATGKGDIADRIVERAVEAGVQIESNAALAGALAQLDIDQAIPPELFRAVAQVIGFLLRKVAPR
jgi:flagellar biosynthesis protein